MPTKCTLNERPLVRGLKKLLTHIRWMGCTVAVYDCVLPKESGVRAERSGPSRRTNRRGKRSGRRNARKCRRLVTADPSSDDSLVAKRQYYRASYLEARLVSYVRRSAVEMTKLQKQAGKIRALLTATRCAVTGVSSYKSRVDPDDLLRRFKQRFCAMVDILSSVTGSPKVLAKARFSAVVRSVGGNPPGFKFRTYTSSNPWRTLDYTEVLEMFKDFKEVRYPAPVEPVGLVQLARKPISMDVLCWVGSQARYVTSVPALQTRTETRLQVANAPCVYCTQAPCRRPGLNRNGIPLCKRSGYVDLPLDRQRKRR